MGFTAERNTWGKQKEIELYQIIQSLFDEPLIPTESPTDKKDWVSDNWLVELKSRRGKYTSNSFKTWWVPVSKFEDLGNKKLAIFYYWDADKTLWRLKIDPERIDKYKIDYPWDGFAPSKQLHYAIPAEDFQLVQIVP
jgi:hypothetical protein